MEAIFLNQFAPKASRIKLTDKFSFSFYQTIDSLFILSNTIKTGIITDKIKAYLQKEFKDLNKSVFLVNMFVDKGDMKNFDEEIAWGSYAWFKNSPNHYIHFDDAPSKLMIHHR